MMFVLRIIVFDLLKIKVVEIDLIDKSMVEAVPG
jgi:hypothetical protein